MTDKFMQQVVTAINTAEPFFAASFEYPGYIAIGEWAFGTANGPWQGDLHGAEGLDLGGVDLGIPESETNAAYIAAMIVRVVGLHTRVDDACEAAEEAFSDVLGKEFPEAKTGDVDALELFQLHASFRRAIRSWVTDNVFEPQKECGYCFGGEHGMPIVAGAVCYCKCHQKKEPTV